VGPQSRYGRGDEDKKVPYLPLSEIDARSSTPGPLSEDHASILR